MIHFEENKICSWRELFQALWPKNFREGEFINGMIFTGSGKAAIKIVLDYLKTIGVIENKNSEILVPRWLGYWVYNMIHKTAFPSFTYNQNIKVMLVYHQYGFPQDMDKIIDFAQDKKLVIIEDCAHAYESYYKGKRLGSFGLASIFSFSKMFATFMGGAVLTKDDDLYEYASGMLKANDPFISAFSLFVKILAEKISLKFVKYVEMSYAVYDRNTKINKVSLNLLQDELLTKAVEKRRKNYFFLLDYFKNHDFFRNLERDALPYVVPLIAEEDRLEKVSKSLNRAGIKTGIYHFDINRNLLNPKFVKCAWVPVHQGLNFDNMNCICEVIRGAV